MRDAGASQYSWETLHDVLGIPLGASVDHIQQSYKLHSNKNAITDAAYRTLIDPEERAKYAALLHPVESRPTDDGKSWGKRGRERCSCGCLLGKDDEWLCQECWERQVYFVAFDIDGGHIVHQGDFPWPRSDSEKQTLEAVTFGPFTSEEAEEFLARTTRQRNRGSL